MKNLKSAFDSRRTWHNNRSSTVFPCFPTNTTTHYLVFQDYWSWKSGIRSDQIKCIIRLHDSKTGVAIQTQEYEINPHNCINLNEELGISVDNLADPRNPFSFEIEFISTCNLGFPFPGVMLFCVDEKSDEVTCVHSGGRRLNANEGKYLKNYTETNWLAIQNDEFTPFFHVFNDSVEFLSDAQRFVEVSIRLNGEGGASFKSTVNLDAVPFASKLFYAKDIFPQAVIDQINGKEIWIEVQLKATTFPRMIVGNYDLRQDFHYITHSFGRIDTVDYVESNMPEEVSAFLPLLSASPLNLQARSYPTNSPCSIKSKVYEYTPGSEDKNLICESYAFESRGDLINLFQNDSTTLKLYEIVGKCPSRLNVSYNYSLANSRHPTDIATGFKSKDYPPKKSHWGHGVCKRGFRTLILIRNISHSDMGRSVNSPISIDIELLSLDFAQSVSIQIPASGWNYIEINPEEIPALGQEFFSWRFKDTVSTRMETFWVSYNVNTGAICGEHGF